MSAETITTALFLITAVVASAVLINAVYPVVYTMAGTFSSTTHESDVRMRTDFKIVAWLANPGTATVWMKNIGSERISNESIRDSATVLCGSPSDFELLPYDPDADPDPGDGEWAYRITHSGNDITFWAPGETLEVSCNTDKITSDNPVYFQFTLSNGIWRSKEFMVS